MTSDASPIKRLSIVVPVYFNEGSLPDLFRKLDYVEERLRARNLVLEIIFVDDGSRDNSLALLRNYKAGRENIKIIKLTRNFGAISAVKAGIEHVNGDAFLFLAADLQDPPDLIPEMAERWLNAHSMCCASEQNATIPSAPKYSQPFTTLC